MAEMRDTERRAVARLRALKTTCEQTGAETVALAISEQQAAERWARVAQIKARAQTNEQCGRALIPGGLVLKHVGFARLLLRVFSPENEYERDILQGRISDEQIVGPEHEGRKRQFACS